MKKNYMMRLAAVLLVLVLLSTCVISGTFAKYVTTGSAYDGATVAKWGVEITAAGQDAKVLDTLDGNEEAHIISNTGNKLAPGTKGSFGTISVSGKPEVAVSVEYDATVTVTGWTINTDEYYCPVVVKVNDDVVAAGTDAATFAANIKAAIEKLSKASVTAGTDLAQSIEITWEWAFSVDNATDLKDTALGDLGTLPSISVEITATVTQID